MRGLIRGLIGGLIGGLTVSLIGDYVSIMWSNGVA